MNTLFNNPWLLVMTVGLPVLGIAARMLKQSFVSIAKWYCYTAVFAVVVVMNSIFFPFIGGKDWFFRIAVELGLISFLLWWAFEAKDGETKQMILSTVRSPLFIATSIFVGMVLLASVFANDIHAAFWSNYERGEGAFQMLHYYGFFILLSLLFKKEGDWRNLFKFSLVAAGAMISYGVLATLGVSGFIGPYAGGSAPAGFWNAFLLGRFEGTLGNPAYVAPYLVFMMFFAAYLWITGSDASRVKNRARAYGYGALIAIFLFFFILSQTRGAFIGLGAGVFAMLVYFVFSKNAIIKKWSAVALGIFIILGGTAFLLRNTSFVQKLPVGRLFQLSISDATAQTRFWTWGSAWKGFLARPILGWGPENFTTVFDKYFNPKHFAPGGQSETWFDRAHSVFFDYLSETGILGFLAYVGIFITFYYEFFRRRKNASSQNNGGGDAKSIAHSLGRGFLFAIPVAYLIQGMAIFDVLPMYICLFTFLAFAQYYFSVNKQIEHESR